MLILATVGVAVTSVAIWSTIHAQNGFAEILLMLQGQPSFIPKTTFTPSPQAKGEGGPFSAGPEDVEEEGSSGGGGGGGSW